MREEVSKLLKTVATEKAKKNFSWKLRVNKIL